MGQSAHSSCSFGAERAEGLARSHGVECTESLAACSPAVEGLRNRSQLAALGSRGQGITGSWQPWGGGASRGLAGGRPLAYGQVSEGNMYCDARPQRTQGEGPEVPSPAPFPASIAAPCPIERQQLGKAEVMGRRYSALRQGLRLALQSTNALPGACTHRGCQAHAGIRQLGR